MRKTPAAAAESGELFGLVRSLNLNDAHSDCQPENLPPSSTR